MCILTVQRSLHIKIYGTGLLRDVSTYGAGTIYTQNPAPGMICFNCYNKRVSAFLHVCICVKSTRLLHLRGRKTQKMTLGAVQQLY